MHFHSYTNTQHNALLHNSLAKVGNGLGREQGKVVLISTKTITQEHNALLHNSLAKVENGLGGEQEKVVLIPFTH